MKFNTINHLYTKLEGLYIKKMKTLQKINKMKHSNKHPEYAKLLDEPLSLKKLSEEYYHRKINLHNFVDTLANLNEGRITKESLYNNIEKLALKSEAFVNARIELNHNIGIYRHYKRLLAQINDEIDIIKDQIRREITLQHDTANREIENVSEFTGHMIDSKVPTSVNTSEPREYEANVYAYNKDNE